MLYVGVEFVTNKCAETEYPKELDELLADTAKTGVVRWILYSETYTLLNAVKVVFTQVSNGYCLFGNSCLQCIVCMNYYVLVYTLSGSCIIHSNFELQILMEFIEATVEVPLTICEYQF